ncbi:MAG: glycosyl hydrolase [Bacteroidales bacterium]
MKNNRLVFKLFALLIMLGTISCVERPWQKLNNNSVNDIASQFKTPPVEYSISFYWGWDGEITEEVIARDLDAFKERGVHIVSLESGYEMGHPYLSEEWFKLVKRTVELAKERDMRVWIVDEGKYPSGFAGGKFTTDAPELRMKALVVDEKFQLSVGDTLVRRLNADYHSAVAINISDSTNQILDISSDMLDWKAPEGKWEVILVKHDFRSSPTRAVNNPTRGKDPSNSLLDYLDPAATKKFLEFTHEEYKKYVGDEFGKTVLGFRGDEPDYSIRGIPWTNRIFEIFKEQKGYDIEPYVASFFAPVLTDEQKRMKADYWDVWSGLFGAYFFKQQADWCAAHNMEYLVHLNSEDKMMRLVHGEGDFFRCMREVHMPGVDAIWNQIWPDKVADFPKYASSAAHIFGRPRAFTESFAAYHVQPDVQQAKWVLDHQLVRGINMVEVMFIPASAKGQLGFSGWTAAEEFSSVASYIHRACFLLSQGRPAAQIAIYHPGMGLWLDHEESNNHVLKLMQQLLEQQHDFDFIDEYTVTRALNIEKSALKNLSGQRYQVVLVPSAIAISKTALDRLKTFALAGGKVVFLGREPSLLVGKTFLNAAPADISWAVTEPSDSLTTLVLESLPEPDVKFSKPNPAVKYVHRQWRDADLYFFFNESPETVQSAITLSGEGTVQEWNAMTGEIEKLMPMASDKGMISMKLELEPYGTKFIIIGNKPSGL